MSDDDPPPVARFHWSYWLVGAVVCVPLIAAIVCVYQREPPESTGGTPVTASNPSVGGFPPAFNDPRDDLSQRSDFVEVCGVGRVRLQPNGGVDLPEIATAARQVLRQAAARLAASSNDYDRAVGLYVQSVEAAEQALSDYAVARPGCNRDKQCEREAMTFALEAGAAATDQLARHAIGSRSPGIYALAFYRCQRWAEPAPASGACAQISSAQWAQIEPDNAAPWLYEAESAARRKDARALDEALLRASRARTLRLHARRPSALPTTASCALTMPLPRRWPTMNWSACGLRCPLPISSLRLSTAGPARRWTAPAVCFAVTGRFLRRAKLGADQHADWRAHWRTCRMAAGTRGGGARPAERDQPSIDRVVRSEDHLAAVRWNSRTND